MSKIVYLSLLLNLLTACSTKKVELEDLEVINLEQGIKEGDSINLTQIGSNIEYISLETNDSIVLGNLDALVTESNIIVLDYNSGIYLFDRKGKFAGKIGQKGQGPGEYGNIGSLENISIDEELQEILVKTDSKQEIIKFGYDGTYSKFVDINSCQGFVFYNSTLFAHKASLFFKTESENNHQLTVFDTKGRVLNQFHPADVNKTKYLDMFMEIPNFSISEDKVFYYVMREATIYNITRDGCVPFYGIDLGRFSFEKDYKWDYDGYYNARKGNKIWLVCSFVAKSYVFFLVEQAGKRRVVVYDKKTDKVYNRLTNNIDCLPVTYLSKIYGNKIVTSFSTSELLECANRNNFPNDLKRILKDIKNKDNSILRIISLN